MSTPGLVLASWSAPIRPRVSAVLGRWMEIASARRSSSSSVDQLDAELGGAGRRDVRVVGDQLDAERGEPLGEQLADLAEADDADGLAGELHAGERAALPLPRRAGSRRPPGTLPGDREQQRDRVLGGGDDVGRRRVDDQHAARGGGRHLDVVQPDAGAGDDLELVAAASTSASTLVAERTSSASASATRGEQRGPVGAVDVADLDLVAEQRRARTGRASRRSGRRAVVCFTGFDPNRRASRADDC